MHFVDSAVVAGQVVHTVWVEVVAVAAGTLVVAFPAEIPAEALVEEVELHCIACLAVEIPELVGEDNPVVVNTPAEEDTPVVVDNLAVASLAWVLVVEGNQAVVVAFDHSSAGSSAIAVEQVCWRWASHPASFEFVTVAPHLVVAGSTMEESGIVQQTLDL